MTDSSQSGSDGPITPPITPPPSSTPAPPTNPSPIPQPVASSPPQSTKPNLKPFVIPAIILAILIPSLVIFFQLRNNSKSAQPGTNISQVKFPTPSPLPSSSPESTTSAWIVYKNPDYNYTLRYPSTLNIQETDSSFESTHSASKKVSMTSFSDKDKNTFNIFFEGEFDHGMDPWALESTDIATISGMPATKKAFAWDQNPNKWIMLTIPNFHNFRIEIQGPQSFLNLADQIIETIKFSN